MSKILRLLFVSLILGTVAAQTPIISVYAQFDTSVLPQDLFVLLNEGVIRRYDPTALNGDNAAATDVSEAGAFVLDFAVAPDDRAIAYRTPEGLFRADLSGDLPVTGELLDAQADVPALRGRGRTIAWAVDGQTLAYTTLSGIRVYQADGNITDVQQPNIQHIEWSPNGGYLAAETEDNIWWVYRYDTTGLNLTAPLTAFGATWLSADQLIFASSEGGLNIIHLDEANRQTVILPEEGEYRLPHITTDGRLIFFGRIKDNPNVPAGYGNLIVLSSDRQTLESINSTSIELPAGSRWTPNGSRLVTLTDGVLVLTDPITGDADTVELGDVVAYDWSHEGSEVQVPVAATAEPTPSPTVELTPELQTNPLGTPFAPDVTPATTAETDSITD